MILTLMGSNFCQTIFTNRAKYGLIEGAIFLLGLNEGPLNPLLSEVVFEIELVKAYSSVSFEDFNEGVFKEYDILDKSGIIEAVIKNIPVQEYEEICRLYNETLKETMEYNKSLLALLTGIIGNLSNSLKEVGED